MTRGHAAQRIVIMGAAGRDFHDFNMRFRDDPASKVVAFTAAQIPDIDDRRYPASLAGPLYPDGIPIRPEAELAALIEREQVDQVYLAYSDLPHVEVMHRASIALAAGASFGMLGPRATQLEAAVPVISVCAVRTGVGKSALSRFLVRWLLDRGVRAAAVVDKDLSAALLADQLEADALLLLTDVDAVYRGWGTADATPIRTATVAALRAQSFAAGSMGPKVEAACRFVQAAGRNASQTTRIAAIGALDDAERVLDGRAGTRITA